MGALKDTILQFKLPLKQKEGMINKLSTYVKTYEEPELDENGKALLKVKNNSGKDERKASEQYDGDNNNDVEEEEK